MASTKINQFSIILSKEHMQNEEDENWRTLHQDVLMGAYGARVKKHGEGGWREVLWQIAQEIAKRQVSKDNKKGDIKDNKHESTARKALGPRPNDQTCHHET